MAQSPEFDAIEVLGLDLKIPVHEQISKNLDELNLVKNNTVRDR